MNTVDAATVIVRRLDRPAPELAGMTFPAYRHLLALERTPRHPEQGDDRLVDPVAVAAWSGGRPLGLALGELPVERDRPAELLSILVVAEHRRQGIAGALLEGLEEAAAGEGFSELAAVYTAGTPACEAVERLFARHGWSAPEPRTLSVQFTPQAFLAAPAFAPRLMAVLSRGLEIFPWAEVTAQELEALERSQEESPWIQPALAPWRFLSAGYDPSSVAARYRGRIVGWVINHPVSPGVVRFTCTYMHPGVPRRGRILPLYRASIESLSERCRLCTFTTPFSYPTMIRFIRDWLTPVSTRVTETRGVSKGLSGGV